MPLSSWTMVKEGSKCVKIAGVADKQQIAAVLDAIRFPSSSDISR